MLNGVVACNMSEAREAPRVIIAEQFHVAGMCFALYGVEHYVGVLPRSPVW